MYGSIRCISIYRYLYVEYLCIHSNPKNAEFDSERVMHNFSFFWGELLTLSLYIYVHSKHLCYLYILYYADSFKGTGYQTLSL